MHHERRPSTLIRRTAAFTIAEVLVCIGIIGMIAALIVPAVQSARKMECKNKLRQIGIALHAFEGARAQFPRGGDMVLDGSGGQYPRAHAPHLYLLPYLEQSPLYSRIDLRLAADRDVPVIPGVNDANEPVKQLMLPVFLCPSDGGALSQRRNNYRANTGLTPFARSVSDAISPLARGDGAFYPVGNINLSQGFADGLSNTVGFSERIAGDGDPKRYTPARDLFLISMNELNASSGSPNSGEYYIRICASLTDPNPPHDSTLGEFWFYGGLPDTWYNHLLTPNHAIPDCGVNWGMNSSGVVTARSLHLGGVNCLMMDGAVRFVGNSIDLRVWRAVATRNGHETSSLD
jgi:type II secretory pathway pseudopilin PulG